MDVDNEKALVNKKIEKHWSPVDLYIGGAEHATRHLVYARFWHKFLNDINVVKHSEPFKKLQHVGLINATDGRKMSKRWGNVINPDDIIGTYGADALRVYEMFMGPFDQSIAWNTESMIGPRRFIEKVWRLSEKIVDTESIMEGLIHQTIKKVGSDIDTLDFNTAISALMILVNKIESLPEVSRNDYETVLRLLAPFAPHVVDEIWQNLGHEESIHISEWPEYDEKKILIETITLGIQVNGKVRAEIELTPNENEDSVKEKVMNLPGVKKWIDGKEVKKFIYIPGKIINIVVSA